MQNFIKSSTFSLAASITTRCLLIPYLIGSMASTKFWLPLLVKVINDVPHIRAKVAGKKILISEATIRADLLFDDEHGVDCFPKQVIWDLLRDIGYEVLIRALSWNNFKDKHALHLVGLATNQKFRSMFVEQHLEGVDRPQDFITIRFTPSKVETALAAEEKHSTIPPIRASNSSRNAQGTPTQSDAHISMYFFSTSIKHLKKQKRRRKKHKKKVSSVKLGRNKEEGILSEEHYVQNDTADPFFEDIVDKDAAVTPDIERKSDETEEINVEEKEASNVKSGEFRRTGFGTTQSYYLYMGQGYKNLKKLKYPQMKELYEKVQESIKDSFKDFVPMDSEKEKQILKERDEKRLLRKRKAIISEEQTHKEG
ncbi:hypothetical protein Tco_0776659 [Tanacetum coccineum]